MNESNGIDDATTALILQLENQDIEELLRAGKGKGRYDEQSDADLALSTYQKELQDRITILADQRMSQSLAQAVISDGTLLSESRAQESAAVRDQFVARCLNEGRALPSNPDQTTAEDELDDCVIARLTVLYTPDRKSDALPDDDLVAAESSARAESRQKPSAEVRSCAICLTDKSLSDVLRMPCGDNYCRECLSELFQLATTDESMFPPRCCQQVIPLQLIKLYLSSTLIRTFEEKSNEYKASNRTYCSQPSCSLFISSENIDGERATCIACGTHTCTICKNNVHSGDCPMDTATHQTLEIGRQHGWQRCYSCRQLVELDTGCNHMTYEFP